MNGTVLSSALRFSFGRGGPNYTPNVTYSYQVDGTDYVGKRLDFTESVYTFRTNGRRRLEAYDVGAPVNVYYDPDTHGRSVIEPGARIGLYVGMLFFGVMFVMGILHAMGWAI